MASRMISDLKKERTRRYSMPRPTKLRRSCSRRSSPHRSSAIPLPFFTPHHLSRACMSRRHKHHYAHADDITDSEDEDHKDRLSPGGSTDDSDSDSERSPDTKSRSSSSHLFLIVGLILVLLIGTLLAIVVIRDHAASSSPIVPSPLGGATPEDTSSADQPTSPPSSSTTAGTSASSSTSAKSSTSSGAARPMKSATKATMYLPVEKIRGVNIGGLFVFEEWMSPSEWQRIGCGDAQAEWDCMKTLGKEKGTAAFVSHWSTWYTQDDFTAMASYGLNTIRVPVGYWMVDALIGGDYYAPGGFKYLKRLCSWAKAAGIYVLIDLHAAPGASAKDSQFAGQMTDDPQFYTNANFERTYPFFVNITTEVHQDDDFSTVFALQALNEPLSSVSNAPGMISTYYPGVQKTVRDTEASLGIKCTTTDFTCLSIMYMDMRWEGGNSATANLDKSDEHIVFDDHDYVHWSGIDNTRDATMNWACKNNPSSDDSPVVVGEWSIMPVDDTGDLAADGDGAAAWYLLMSQAAMASFEKNAAGWLFWSWKTDLDSPFWSYQYAVEHGFITKDPSKLDTSGCT